MRPFIAVTTIMPALVLLVGCSTGQEGQPQPAPTSAPVSSAGADTDPAQKFGDLDSCVLLDKALAGQGFSAGEADNVGSANGCSASKVGSATSLNLDDKQGVDDLKVDPAKAHAGKINGRRIRQVQEIDGSEATCLVLLEVAATARAMVSVTLGTQGGTEQACQDAFSLAEAVEPQLPQT